MAKRTRQQVLAEFDRAIGLDVTTRTSSAPTVSSPATPTAPSRAPAISVEPRPDRPDHPDRPDRAPAATRSTATVSSAHPATLSPTPTPPSLAWSLAQHWLTSPGDTSARAARLAEIRAHHDQHCPHCTTATAHTQTVFGEGNPAAELVFIGEAPGETEDTVGRPFVGRAGQKLDEMIKAMGLQRSDVYIANVLKSRPPENRTPLQHEIDACGPFLVAQLLAIAPRVIVTLGGPAAKLVLNETTGITRLRGCWREWSPPAGAPSAPIPVMPTYHPAYVLRNYTAKVRGEVWHDLKQVLTKLGRTAPAESKSS